MGRVRVAIAIAACGWCASPTSATDGNELVGIGAIQQSMTGAGIASPQDSTWALLNPAAMVSLDQRVDAYFTMLFNEINADVRGFPLLSNPAAQNLTNHNFIPFPSFGVVLRPTDDTAIGFGGFGVEGNMLEYSKSRATITLLQHEDRRSEYEVAKFPLSYAYRFDNGWAIGGSLVGVATRFRTDSITLQLRPTSGDFERDWGFGAGLQFSIYKEWEHVSIGATYTTRQIMQEYEKYQDLVQWNLDLPQKFQAGIAIRPTEHLEFVLDYKWIGWSDINLLANPSVRGGLGWENQQVVKSGVTYDPEGPWTFHAGISYGKSPISENDVFVNVLTPAIAEVHAGFGVSYDFPKGRTLHVGYLHTVENEMQEKGQGDLFSRLGKGSTISYGEEAVTIQYSIKF